MLGLGLFTAVISISAKEPAKEQAVKEDKPAPLVATDFECWKLGTVLVAGGWTTNEDRDGFTWFFSVSEILDADEGGRKMRGRFRRVGGLDMAKYQRMQRMDDAAFLKAFGELHEEQPEVDYEYWNEARDAAVFYRDNDKDDDGFHKPDISVPKDLTLGTKFRAFGKDMIVAGYEKVMAAPGGVCEAVRLDFTNGGEIIDGEEYLPFRVENWYGRGLSNLAGRVVELENEQDEKGQVMEEWRLQRVIRPVAKLDK